MAGSGQQPKKRRWPVRFLAASGMMIALGAFMMNGGGDRLKGFMPLEYVRVEGPIWHTDMDEFRKVVMPLARGSYFLIDLEAIEAAARTSVWIDGVRATRVWPDTLALRIREQQAVARWGEDGLLNDRGERFVPRGVAPFGNLPGLSGPPGQEKQVLETMRALNARLQSRQWRIETLKLSRRLAWVARTVGGLEIVFGNQDPLSALDRVLVLLPQLGEGRVAAIQKLDLRYPNGFSVVWKPEPRVPPESLSRTWEEHTPGSDLKDSLSNG